MPSVSWSFYGALVGVIHAHLVALFAAPRSITEFGLARAMKFGPASRCEWAYSGAMGPPVVGLPETGEWKP